MKLREAKTKQTYISEAFMHGYTVSGLIQLATPSNIN